VNSYLESWPLFNIELRRPEVTLRPVRETDLPELAGLLPDDVEYDPAAAMLEGLDLGQNRRRLSLQDYWSHWGGWRPESWHLLFAVVHGGALVGCQSLEGDHFPVLRTVDSASWLATAVRGLGLGKSMRAAVLALAFEHLEATAAISSARHDNLASLGVSYSIGYRPNGVSISDSPTGPCELTNVRLTRQEWFGGQWCRTTEVRGLAGCEAYFGLAAFATADQADGLS
jgi:RimJ/RimL family protein N-acetyltransferase